MVPKAAPLKLYDKTDYTRLNEEGDRLQCFSGRPYVDSFRNDLLRVTHSPFFRRLQGKTQLFPAGESDYFRNRLTHSLEVSSIAETIVLRINSLGYFSEPVNQDLIRVAALCHDAGHPPFGHRGERALAQRMRDAGGFEGNAQTLHLLLKGSKLIRIKPQPRYGISKSADTRAGLNLSVRALASVLKYDREIPISVADDKSWKGYYTEEKDFVCQIKEKVTRSPNYGGAFRTIECEIMDVADDIAYSIFDLEDALHAGFVRVSDLLGGREHVYDAGLKAGKELKKKGYECPSDLTKRDSAGKYVLEVFWRLLGERLKKLGVTTEFCANLAEPKSDGSGKLRNLLRRSEEIGFVGYDRSAFAFELMHSFIDSVRVEVNANVPALSKVRLGQQAAIDVECLKQYVARAVISRSRVQTAEWRANRLIGEIFDAIVAASEDGADLLPEDFSEQLRAYGTEAEEEGSSRLPLRRRLICDFIAGMTERYALEFHGRLYSALPQTLFKPL